jgi:hypothetical protein
MVQHNRDVRFVPKADMLYGSQAGGAAHYEDGLSGFVLFTSL